MIKLITSSDAIMRKISQSKTATNYITREITEAMSLAKLIAENLDELEKTEYDRIYFVLRGVLELEIEGQKIKVQTDDSIFIGKQTEYRMLGTFECLVVNSPAFGA